MTWKELKDFCNGLPEGILDSHVQFHQEFEVSSNLSASVMDEGHFFDPESPEEGAIPLSQTDYETPEEALKAGWQKAYSAGYPFLFERS